MAIQIHAGQIPKLTLLTAWLYCLSDVWSADTAINSSPTHWGSGFISNVWTCNCFQLVVAVAWCVCSKKACTQNRGHVPSVLWMCTTYKRWDHSICFPLVYATRMQTVKHVFTLLWTWKSGPPKAFLAGCIKPSIQIVQNKFCKPSLIALKCNLDSRYWKTAQREVCEWPKETRPAKASNYVPSPIFAVLYFVSDLLFLKS